MSTSRLATVDLNLLLVLDALLETRSTVLAAERLSRSQSAISHALNRLRDLFRDPLFVRVGHSFRPTAFAISLIDPLRQTLGATERLLFHSASFEVAELECTFTLSMNDVIQAILLPQLVPLIARQAPRVEFIIRTPDADTPRGIQRGEIDAELDFGTEPSSSAGLVRQVLHHDELVCVVRQDNPRFRERLSLEEFLAYEHVGVSSRGRTESVVDRSLERIGHTRRVLWWTTHAFTALRIATSTELMATLPATFLRATTHDHPVRILAAPAEISLAPSTMVWSAARRTDPVHTWLRSMVKQCCDQVCKDLASYTRLARRTSRSSTAS